jgi:GNAT superfamily N-acetyltransferase
MAWQIIADADNLTAYSVLARDRIWNCFAIADLAPPFRQYCRFVLALRDDAAEPEAACLLLEHPAFAVVSPFGAPEGVASILAEIDLPEQAQIQALPEHLAAVSARYRFATGPRAMLRMALPAGHDPAPPATDRPVERLTPADLPALRELYTAFPANHFRDDLIAHGIFCGVRDGSDLLAAGGTHVVAPTYGMGVIGSVFTMPEVRGRGYAGAITAAVTTALHERGCADVVLNVVADNDPAIRVYTRLAFVLHAHYHEGQAERI